MKMYDPALPGLAGRVLPGIAGNTKHLSESALLSRAWRSVRRLAYLYINCKQPLIRTYTLVGT